MLQVGPLITYETSRNRDPKPFFDEFACDKASFNNGEKNLSVDGSGEEVSVDLNIAGKIARYVKAKFPGDITVLDIGTGMGHLVTEYLRHSINGYGAEGYGALCNRAECPKDRLVCMDLSRPITDPRLSKAFNLTTSFELVEHVHRNHQDIFFNNLAFLSDYHLCSIHVWGWPGTNEKHCNIKHECCWLEYFRTRNIQFEVVGAARKRDVDPAWADKPGAIGGHLHPNTSNEFYEHVFQQGGWECSFFVVLDLRKII